MIDAAEIERLVAYGPLAVFALAALERSLPFIPSYVLFVAIGTLLVGSWVDLLALTLLSAAASTLGSAPWYAAGAWLGPARTRAWVARRGRWLFLSLERYDRLVTRFNSNAWAVVFIAQLVPTARILVALPAGVLGVSLRGYAIATFLGCALWNGALVAIGVAVSRSDISMGALLFGFVVIVLAVEGGCWIAVRRRRARRPAVAATR
ncbi:MAG: VTT domain-containing protein [Pseudomonadota bacterium]